MLSKILSYGINGMDAYPVEIEVDVAKGLPATIIVGLPDNAVKESKERVRAAIKNSGYKFKPKRITVNLSPADIKKEGPAFDLPISLGILAATEQIDASHLNGLAFLGELSLDGLIRPVNGILPTALAIPKDKLKGIVLPFDNAIEAAVTRNVPVYPARHLNEVIHFLQNNNVIQPLRTKSTDLPGSKKIFDVDFSDVKGQALAKRGLEIACAGGHNCLMIGPPGSGKSMLAKRISTILPDMTMEESLETTKIHSILGLVPPQTGLITQRPFRSPHHTSSDIALIGGGSFPRPGEVTLSHNGVLYLDELPEFNRNVLEALRQPLEDRSVTVSRARKTIKFPAQFMLVCSMNPCPCGWYTDPKKECHCTPQQIRRYISKISGPLLDRIDIHLEVASLPSGDLLSAAHQENSAAIRQRITQARTTQLDRFRDAKIFANAQMTSKQTENFCRLDGSCRELLRMAIEEMGFSARATNKVLKVARTITDLDGSDHIRSEHIAEAIQYRCLDRDWWG